MRGGLGGPETGGFNPVATILRPPAMCSKLLSVLATLSAPPIRTRLQTVWYNLRAWYWLITGQVPAFFARESNPPAPSTTRRIAEHTYREK